MSDVDVFNGDADGLCALHQWRLAHPATNALVTGVKRDIKQGNRMKVMPARAVERDRDQKLRR